MNSSLLLLFITNILNYEEGIYDIIKYYTKTYTFKDNNELRQAVKLWYNDREQALKLYGHISFWDVSLITDMSRLFMGLIKFNDDISRWNVSNVTNMVQMFTGCECFNQDISEWDVSNVYNMLEMFAECYYFNQNISRWNVSRVKNTVRMFDSCSNFDQDLASWKPKLRNEINIKYVTGNFMV